MNARIAADSAVASLLGVPVRLSLRLAEPRRTHRPELRWMLSRR
jgi:cytochrome c oxidase assembly factor CtaG